MTNRRLRSGDESDVPITESAETKKRKVSFEDNKDKTNEDHETTIGEDTKEITSRREVLSFKIKGINNE